MRAFFIVRAPHHHLYPPDAHSRARSNTRIPEKLLRDKRKTQCRFKAMRRLQQMSLECVSGASDGSILPSTITRDKRGVSIVTKRVHSILRDVIVPLGGRGVDRLPRLTTFEHTDDDRVREVFEAVRDECPEAFQDAERWWRPHN